MFRCFLLLSLAALLACGQPAAPAAAPETDPQDPPLSLGVTPVKVAETEKLLGANPAFEVLLSGLDWAEGPLLLPDGRILCSDVPRNHILFYHTKNGEKGIYLDNSGSAPNAYSSEPGSNGLHLDANNQLLLCQHGARRVVRMNTPLASPSQDFTVLADNYRGKRFNSPNDLVVAADGSVLFTDPSYGLHQRQDSPLKELAFNGVYRIAPGGQVQLLSKDYLQPNGIGLSPDGKILYVADSDRRRLTLTATPILNDTFALGVPVRLIDAADLAGKEVGSTDGLAVAKNGRIFATAPGGVWVLEPDGSLIAKIHTGLPVANVELAPREDWLYLTSDYYLIRIKLN